MTTLKARAQLRAGELDFRIKELKRLIEKHERDPDFAASCMSWRKELTDIRAEQATGLPPERNKVRAVLAGEMITPRLIKLKRPAQAHNTAAHYPSIEFAALRRR